MEYSSVNDLNFKDFNVLLIVLATKYPQVRTMINERIGVFEFIEFLEKENYISNGYVLAGMAFSNSNFHIIEIINLLKFTNVVNASKKTDISIIHLYLISHYLFKNKHLKEFIFSIYEKSAIKPELDELIEPFMEHWEPLLNLKVTNPQFIPKNVAIFTI